MGATGIDLYGDYYSISRCCYLKSEVNFLNGNITGTDENQMNANMAVVRNLVSAKAPMAMAA